ncbi:hypothetical protein [Streptomyces sp. NPDC005322]|uniref:hypothetical protein n=1 Tax=unclassified Streptomyces TaxID=2593676 RepID=UPI0033AECB39
MAGIAAGAALGVAGGIVAAESVDEIGDTFDEPHGTLANGEESVMRAGGLGPGETMPTSSSSSSSAKRGGVEIRGGR